MRSKKGVSIILSIGMLTAFAVTIVMLFFVFQGIIKDEALGQAYFVSKDLASTLTVAYAAPESVEIGYEVPVGSDGYPQAGSILIDAENQIVGVSQWSEDEMWLRITNGALVAWGFGQVISTTRTAKRIIPSTARREANEKFAKELVENRLKRTEKYAAHRSSVVAENRLASAVGRSEGRAINRKLSSELGEKFTKEAGEAVERTATKRVEQKIAQQQTRRFSKLVAQEGAEEGTQALVGIGKRLGRLGRWAILRLSGAGASAGAAESSNAVAPGVGRGIAIGIMVASFGVDFWLTTLPLSLMIIEGHDQSAKMYDTIVWQGYSGSGDELYVDPPNCKPGTEFLRLDVELLGAPLPLDIPLDVQTDETQPVRNTVTSEGQCYRAQNFFISASEGDTDFGGGDTAVAVITTSGVRYACAALGAATSPVLGIACATDMYIIMGGKYYDDPEAVLNWFLAADFLEKDQQYYLEFPYFIQVSKEYDSSTGESQVKVVQIA